MAACGVVDSPPAAYTLKPRTPSRTRATKPRSLMAPSAQSVPQPLKAILNLRGRLLDSGWRKKWRTVASAYGVTSNAALGHTSASSQAVMLRTELPHASRVVSPASSRRRMMASHRSSFTKCSWMFWRVVTCANPRECSSATSAIATSCCGPRRPKGILMRNICTSGCRCP
jgi:hypothetical protein